VVRKAVSLMAGRKIALVLEYDGTNYAGFQWQANSPTIQAEIEEAILKLTGERRRVLSASRTDVGVHARGQVVSFHTNSSLPLSSFVKGLNYYLPEDIAVKEAYRIKDSFSIRRDAVSREYHYAIINSPTRSPLRQRFAHQVKQRLNHKAMHRACQALIGEHDFASFISRLEPYVKSTIKNVYQAEVSREEDLVTFRITANSFLPHQVRNTVGPLIKVGLGKMTAEEFQSLVEAKKIGLAGPTAPACGLCLMKISYPIPLEEICK
jgi:tRNA pseudouridine38-40 synthase